ncbi:tyrosine-protein phosphatase [Reichenbachiella sp. MSK19-1]|uniref:tyrosine-protein phosphatase n=1 Tax=Reichenbachiella sp. MSK19-1 TaxID=1897631 RepID=UPI000E6CD3C0|nr:CpsB/CapC family capsule biosynthesis tyrosine phosphatase [Reichenbachiella sp. MSK19-1]RJE71365.1 hypothetical protein BGP76_04505 [Reichenbachiella sp. MSK19-1]
MINWFNHRKPQVSIHTDLHSHLIPGIDDGVKSWEQSLNIIQGLYALGVNKIITTPHIINDYYPNKPETILAGVEELNQRLTEADIKAKVIAGAEYYIDDWFIAAIDDDTELLTFGNQYILVETAFMNKPLQLEEVFFKLRAKGFTPILAHPERYQYLQENYSLIQPIIDMGVKLQINSSSFIGYYSKEAKKTAEHLVKQGQVHFIGSDIHHDQHLANYQKAMKTKYFKKAGQLSLLNNSL